MEQTPPDNESAEPEIDLDDAATGSPASSAQRSTAYPPAIFFNDDVVAAMKRHACSDTSREIAGIMVGYADIEHNKVFVEAHIEAEHTEASQGNVTFTHDTWAQINRVMDSEYPDYVIVGWYHSHPNFGIFLSSYDQFIHRNFFSAPWQVAFVIDPVRTQSGWFRWEDEHIVSAPVVTMQVPVSDEETQEEDDMSGFPQEFTACSGIQGPSLATGASAGQRWALGILSVLVAVAVLLQLTMYVEIMRLNTKIDKYAASVAPVAITPPDAGLGDDIAAEPPAVSPEATTAAEPAAEVPTLATEIYEVMPGDTLASISTKFYQTSDHAGMLAVLNGLSPDVQLKAGDKLIIPTLPAQKQPETAGE